MVRPLLGPRVISPDGITELFRVLAGILQEDILAPYLFIIIVDYILRKGFKDNDHGNPWQGWKKVMEQGPES